MNLIIDNKLYDTFWVRHRSNLMYGKTISIDIDDNCTRLNPSNINYSLLGNIYEMNEIFEDDKKYFDDNDILDLRHSNNSNAPIYVKKDAKRSKKKMLEILKYKISSKNSEIHSLSNQIKDLLKVLDEVDHGNLEVKFY